MNTNISNNPGKSAGKSVERKVAIITGGSRGLGRNTALHLARKGVDVIITFRSRQSEADTVVAEIVELGGKAVALPLDVGNSKSFAEFVERIGATLRTHWQRDSFDYLVNNAGIGIHASFAETSEAQFDELMNVHFKGTFFLTQALLPLIVDGGRIVNLSSGLARFALPGFAAYAAMKGAIEVLTRYLAKELGPRGIAVNTVAPGAIETDFGGGQVRDNAQLNAQIAAQTALGRVGVPDDIGGVGRYWRCYRFPVVGRQSLDQRATPGSVRRYLFVALELAADRGASRRHAWRQGLAKALMLLLPAGFLQ